jgi:hypothetical protein
VPVEVSNTVPPTYCRMFLKLVQLVTKYLTSTIFSRKREETSWNDFTAGESTRTVEIDHGQTSALIHYKRGDSNGGHEGTSSDSADEPPVHPGNSVGPPRSRSFKDEALHRRSFKDDLSVELAQPPY